MTALGASRTWPLRLLVPWKAGNTWTAVANFPSSELPTQGSGKPYVFLVQGVVTRFRPGTAGDGAVEVTLGDSQGARFANYTHSVALLEQNYWLAPGLSRGHPFAFLFYTTSWDTARDLQVRGRVWTNTPNPGQATAEIEGLSVVAFDLTTIGASRYVANFTNHGAPGPSLPYNNAAPLDVMDSDTIPWSSGTERWLVLMGNRIVPGSTRSAYSTWMMRRPTAAWGGADLPWGHGQLVGGPFGTHGSVGRVVANNIGVSAYWSVLGRVYDVTNATTDFGMRAQCLYAPGDPQAWVRESAFFALKVDEDVAFHEVQDDWDPDFYGTYLQPGGLVPTWTQSPALDVTVLSFGVPKMGALPTKSYAHQILQNEALVKTTPAPAFIHTMLFEEGQIDNRVAKLTLFEGNNFPEFRGYRNPDQRGLESFIPIVTSSVVNIGGGLWEHTITLASGHGIPVGQQAQVRVAGSNVAEMNAAWAATASTPIVLKITTGFNGLTTAGTIEVLTSAGGRAWEQVVCLALQDTTPPAAIGLEVAGPEVKISAGGEATELGMLSELTVQPSFPVQGRTYLGRGQIEAAIGYKLTWPTFFTPRRILQLQWQGLTTAERDSLRSFFDGLANTAFKWTMPGDVERPYVLTSFEIPEDDQGRGAVWSARASVLQLVHLA